MQRSEGVDGIATVKRAVEQDFAERVRVNQQELAANLEAKFDYIVCGAGTSGSVVASRLAADPETRILVLEAGGSDEREVITNPNRWPMTLGSELDWGFVAEPNPRLNGRANPSGCLTPGSDLRVPRVSLRRLSARAGEGHVVAGLRTGRRPAAAYGCRSFERSGCRSSDFFHCGS